MSKSKTRNADRSPIVHQAKTFEFLCTEVNVQDFRKVHMASLYGINLRTK